VLFAPAGDHHADAVERAVAARGTGSIRLDLSSAALPVTIRAGHSLRVGDSVIEAGVAVWWRRTGFLPPLPAASEEENRFRAEESEAILLGGLLSLTERWVDHPYVVMTAEHSLRQLAAAIRLGVPTPATIATNEPGAARAFAATAQGPLIAKATSAGVGITPYADVVDAALFDQLRSCLTLLQHAQAASEDVRVVVIGGQVVGWSRPRKTGHPVDWRAADPTGETFVRRDVDGLAGYATAINADLGLRFSVQDWLVVDGEFVFLEVNPSGQWLFLDGAEALVAGALVKVLLDD